MYTSLGALNAYKSEKDTERVSYLPRVIEIVSDRARIQTSSRPCILNHYAILHFSWLMIQSAGCN